MPAAGTTGLEPLPANALVAGAAFIPKLLDFLFQSIVNVDGGDDGARTRSLRRDRATIQPIDLRPRRPHKSNTQKTKNRYNLKNGFLVGAIGFEPMTPAV